MKGKNSIQNLIDQKEIGQSKKVCLPFLDLKATFDCVNREELMKLMREIGFEKEGTNIEKYEEIKG